MQRLHSSSFPRKSVSHYGQRSATAYPLAKNPGNRKAPGISAHFSKSGIRLFVAGAISTRLAEILNFKRRAANKAAIDIRARHETVGVFPGYRATVEHAHILSACSPTKSATVARIAAAISSACSGVAVRPVPIAHMGS